jgi:hypothetical protein
MYLEAIYNIPTIDLIRNHYFLCCMTELSAQPQEQREGQGTSSKQAGGSHINDQHTNFQFGKLWIINGTINP